jgi:hypothetical protein
MCLKGTNPSLITRKPTRIAGLYFLYWEIMYWLAVGVDALRRIT